MTERGATEKLHKVLANLGHGSRRQIEKLIRLGEVSVDGEPASIGMRVHSQQMIMIGSQSVEREPLSRRVLLYNKQAGVEVSHSPQGGRESVFSTLPDPGTGKWMNIGRLDVDTEGLLLFSNDGEYVHLLSHPTSKLERRYRARVDGKLSLGQLEEIRKGEAVVGGRTLSVNRIDLERESSGRNSWYGISICEGRNRVVRRLFENYGLNVSRLIRTGFGPLELPEDLDRGRWLDLAGKRAVRLEAAALLSRQRRE